MFSSAAAAKCKHFFAVFRLLSRITLFLSLLFVSGWISVSASESHTVEVQSGGNVTLMCSNISSTQTETEWFRLINRTKLSCISSMYSYDDGKPFCDGFQNGFEMSSNISTVFLKIKRVDLSDSGLYFCGFYINGHTVIASATHLKVQGDGESDFGVELNTEKESDWMTTLMSVFLGFLTVLTVFLTIVVIVLAVKIRRLQTAVSEELQPERNKVNPALTYINCDLGSDELNYAALNFQVKPKRGSRPASEREMEPHVVYAATR
uniref:Ig-like domain-containing protein n=1 Tax=Sander lucioperca TaxID=283035 RepID=A0A8C9X674_SANLU